MKKILTAIISAGLLVCGCAEKTEDNVDSALKNANSAIEDESKLYAANDNRVLAYVGQPDENGYYSIDLPRAAEDLSSLEQINDRLHFVSAIMAETKVKEFSQKEINSEVYWKTMKQEACFTLGAMAVLNTGGNASISKEDFISLSLQCFGVEPDFKTIKEFKAGESRLSFNMGEGLKGAYGFVMKEYKKDGNKWYVRGNIMESGDKVFASGTFVLEENDNSDIISHKILSFTAE